MWEISTVLFNEYDKVKIVLDSGILSGSKRGMD